MPASDLDLVIEQSHVALAEITKGNAEPFKQLYSRQDDVSLANPFGPVARGRKQVADTIERAASHYRDGEGTSFENVAKYATPELSYIVEVERYRAKVGGREDLAPVALRVTSIFRREDDGWKLVHRHADPITSAQSAESVIQK